MSYNYSTIPYTQKCTSRAILMASKTLSFCLCHCTTYMYFLYLYAHVMAFLGFVGNRGKRWDRVGFCGKRPKWNIGQYNNTT